MNRKEELEKIITAELNRYGFSRYLEPETEHEKDIVKFIELELAASEKFFLQTGEEFSELPPTEQRKLIEESYEH